MMKRTAIFPLVLLCSLVWGQTIKIPIDAVCLEYNNHYNKAYAAVGDYDKNYPNTMIQLDPYNGTVEKQLPLNGEPRDMKTSPDKKHIYLSFLSVPRILKIDLESFTVVDTIDTGGSPVLDFDIMPANENILAVIRDEEPYPSVVLYKYGILMPKQVQTGYDYPSEICIKADGTKLFAYNGVSSGNEGWVMNIVDNGIEYDSIKWDYMLPSSGDIKIRNDLIYDRFGTLLDAFSDSIPKLMARMPVYKFLFVFCAGSEYSEIHGCYLYGHETNNHAYISFFDGHYFNYLGSIEVDDYSDAVHDMTVVDADDFILRAYDTENYMCLLFHHENLKSRVFLEGKNTREKWENERMVK